MLVDIERKSLTPASLFLCLSKRQMLRGRENLRLTIALEV